VRPIGARSLFRVIAIAILVGIVLMTIGPDVIPGLGAGLLDRSAHALAYAAGMAVLLVVGRTPPRWVVTRLVLAAAGLIALGAVLELIQGLEGRDADPVDAAANALGVLSVLMLWMVVEGGLRLFGLAWRRRRASTLPPRSRERDAPRIAGGAR
jgi:hypothetical protein